MNEAPEKDLRDFLDSLKRYKSSIYLLFSIILIIGLGFAIFLPPTYRSSATILIEEQDIPPDLVRSTISTYAVQRIQTISQRVMTRSNLMDIMGKYNLFEEERRRKTNDELIFEMRDKIKLETISSDVIDPRSGRPMTATIAFMLSFEDEQPAIAQKVTNELTTLFLNENLKARAEQVDETYKFLSDEALRLSSQIRDLDDKIAKFKEENAGRLPELTQMNQQLLERTDHEITNVDNQIRAIEERQFYLRGNLASVNPTSAIGPDGRPVQSSASKLSYLQSEYNRLSALYSPDHPDLQRIRREIAGLEKNGQAAYTAADSLTTDDVRDQLAAAREKYSDEHPDVLRLTKELQSLEKSPQVESAAPSESANNPTYLMLDAQIKANVSEIKALKDKRQSLVDKLAEYESRLIDTPQVEKEYAAMLRERANALTKHQEIKSKQMEAEVGRQLEKESKGERFSLIDPAQLPDDPISPNRPAIAFLSFILAISGGLGFAAVRESMDSSIKNPKTLVSYANNLPLLASIPYIMVTEETEKRTRVSRTKIIVLIGIIAAVLIAVNFLWIPLDVLWYRGLRNLLGISTI